MLSALLLALPLAQDPGFANLWFTLGDQPADGYAREVIWLPDLNADGLREFLVGNRSIPLQVCDGATRAVTAELSADPSWGSDSRFGDVLERAGDLDGDGIEDFFVSAYNAQTTVVGAGLVRAYSSATLQLLWEVEGWALDQQLGLELCATDDVNGDGVDDLLVGGYYARMRMLSGADGAVLWTTPLHPTASDYGIGATSLHDRDGDGVRELAFGTSRDRGNPIEIRSGADGSLLEEWLPAWARQDGFGENIAEIDDLSGDGIPDLMVSESWDYLGSWGKVHFVNAVTGVVIEKKTFDFRISPGTLAIARDFDGDGMPEVFADGGLYSLVTGKNLGKSGLRGEVLPAIDHNRDGSPDYLTWVGGTTLGNGERGMVRLWGLPSPQLTLDPLVAGNPISAQMSRSYPLGTYRLFANVQLQPRIAVGLGGFWLGADARRVDRATASAGGVTQFLSSNSIPVSLTGVRLYFQALGDGRLVEVSTVASAIVQ